MLLRANATIRFAAAAEPVHRRPETLPDQINTGIDLAAISQRIETEATARFAAEKFSSLRLSVRTPPFHGGESGSIPLGSAKGHFSL